MTMEEMWLKIMNYKNIFFIVCLLGAGCTPQPAPRMCNCCEHCKCLAPHGKKCACEWHLQSCSPGCKCKAFIN